MSSIATCLRNAMPALLSTARKLLLSKHPHHGNSSLDLRICPSATVEGKGRIEIPRPLMIDPQLQGVKWIKQRLGEAQSKLLGILQSNSRGVGPWCFSFGHCEGDSQDSDQREGIPHSVHSHGASSGRFRSLAPACLMARS